ncbi:hypothetical protein B9Z55_025666 [Caenorhabditis nigoni]|uniref:Uncharacterized protein n=1 Tax=Caenorhabditis nigoni TaxID=1611254 RepID=A0A2G5SZL8_9PELO|nr:hypothetical protein B9Z55_025666 [Caenorhabditis nigoni]
MDLPEIDFEALIEKEDEMSPEEEQKMREDARKKEREEREQAKALKRKRMEEAEEKERKRRKNVREELRPKSLEASLRSEFFPDPTKKERFDRMVDKIVDYFEDGSEDFVEEMKKIETSKEFMQFLFEKYKSLELWKCDDEIDEKREIHNWLVFFEESVVKSLRKMTNIPEEVEIEIGQIFVTLKMKAIRVAASSFDPDKFQEKAAKMRKPWHYHF